MPEADGSIRIVTKMDTASLQRQMSTLGKTIERLQALLNKAKDAAQKLREEYQAFVRSTADTIRSDSQKGLEEEKKKLVELAAEYRELTKERERLAKVADIVQANGQEPTKQLKDEIAANEAAISSLFQRRSAAKERISNYEFSIANAENLAKDSEGAKKLAAQMEAAEEKTKNLSDEIERTKEQMSGLQKEAGKVGSGKLLGAVDNLGKKMKKLFVAGVALQMLRGVFSHIRQSIMAMSGLSVVTNVFSEFTSKMREAYASNTQIQGALAKLRGALYSAFYPIYQVVVPALVTLINWIAKAISYIGAFFAALSGKSLDESTEGANNLAKAVGGVGGAAKEANKQLASFDKLNTLSEQSGGGGGGGGGTPVDLAFDQSGVEGFFSWVQEHLELIKTLAKDVGVAIASWALASILTKLLPVESSFKNILGLAMAIFGTYEYVKGFLDAWQNGPDWENIARMIGGVTIAAIGLGLVLGPTAAAISLIVGGIGMLVIGLKDWIEKGELSTQTFWLLEAAIAAVGIGLSLLVGPWAAFVAAIVAGALLIYQNWEKVKESWHNVTKSLTDSFSQAWIDLKELFVNGWNDLKSWWDRLTLGAFHIPVPHFEWTYSEASGLIARALEFVGLPATIPHLNISWYAKGGFPSAGSMFVAGEAGPELVGSFGGRNNAVVNEAQLVQAFRQASSEQVALMQQQNALLTAILNKTGEVTFKPSSAAGRAFQQSLNMYNRALG